ncbi:MULTISPECIES: hypothetical protein [unclassified Streptomyces]|uniref:hypothetical protein n=1 Tax=Streptomyces sp. CNQ-509 TaxID=444103 RepID=UPI000D1498D5
MKKWLKAGDLKPGQWLQTGAGTYVQLTAVRARTAETTVHNLTVDNAHTYHVAVGTTDALVHNCGRRMFEVDSGGVATEIPSINRASNDPAEIPDFLDPDGGSYNRPRGRSERAEEELRVARAGEAARDRQRAVAGAPGNAGKYAKPMAHQLDAPAGVVEGPLALIITGARAWQLLKRRWMR